MEFSKEERQKLWSLFDSLVWPATVPCKYMNFFLSINSYPLFCQPFPLTYICPLLWCTCFFVHVLHFFDTEFSVSFHIRTIVDSCVIVAVVTSHSAFIPLWHYFLLPMMSLLFICHPDVNINGQTGRHLLKKMLVQSQGAVSQVCQAAH